MKAGKERANVSQRDHRTPENEALHAALLSRVKTDDKNDAWLMYLSDSKECAYEFLSFSMPFGSERRSGDREEFAATLRSQCLADQCLARALYK